MFFREQKNILCSLKNKKNIKNILTVEYGFIFSQVQSGVSDIHHEQSGLWKKANLIQHGVYGGR